MSDEQRKMRIVLQERSTGHFYKAPGDWVRGIEEAHSFQSSSEGIEVALHERLRNVQLLFSFDSPDHDFTMPLEHI